MLNDHHRLTRGRHYRPITDKARRLWRKIGFYATLKLEYSVGIAVLIYGFINLF